MSFIKQIETGLSLDNLDLSRASNEIVVFFISNLRFFLLDVYFLCYDEKQIVYWSDFIDIDSSSYPSLMITYWCVKIALEKKIETRSSKQSYIDNMCNISLSEKYVVIMIGISRGRWRILIHEDLILLLIRLSKLYENGFALGNPSTKRMYFPFRYIYIFFMSLQLASSQFIDAMIWWK
jgi:hypothetical protein